MYESIHTTYTTLTLNKRAVSRKFSKSKIKRVECKNNNYSLRALLGLDKIVEHRERFFRHKINNHRLRTILVLWR